MIELEQTYVILKDKFQQLNEIDAKAILTFQWTWQDQFARNIYQSGIRDGTIRIHYRKKTIDWDEMWQKRKFQRVINEWENYTPIFQFNSIGECLFFYKSIFHLNWTHAVEIMSDEYFPDIAIAYKNYLNENKDWKYIEPFLYGSIADLIQNR